MAKKDLIERLSRTSDGRKRTSDGASPKSERETVKRTRVAKGVVRRRRRKAPRREAVEAKPEETPKPERSVERSPRAVRRRAGSVEAVTRTRPEPAPEPTPSAPEPAPPAEARAEAPPEPEAKPEESAAPAPEAVEAEAPAAEAKAEAAASSDASGDDPEPKISRRVVSGDEIDTSAPPPTRKLEPGEEDPRKARERAREQALAEAAQTRGEEPAAEGGDGERPKFKGLGSAVVVPPPGYDPTNPEAFRARQAREAAARPVAEAKTRGRRRRRVASDVGTVPDRRRRRRGGGRGGGIGQMRPRRRRRRKKGPSKPSPKPKAAKRKIRVDGAISVANLAHELSIKAPMVIKKLLEMGQLVTINEMLDIDTATLVANEFDYEIENVGFKEEEFLQHVPDADDEGSLEPRPPVVTIMGHVDHGKTTLLDAIRSARVAAGEAGGITQHIGAYQVEQDGELITFLDTPGHAAFSEMRARGAGVTDIVVLVVAADDGVMPQTVEAIKHAKAADVPIIVAVNKIDKAGANPEQIKTRLGEHELIPEEWGGETLFANVSALKGEGIDHLLEQILLQAEVLELESNPDRHAEGTVIESKLERGRGPVASVLIEHGTLNVGDHVVLGKAYGKVRAMMDHMGERIDEAPPSTPVEIFGLSELPNVGDNMVVVANEKNARTLAEHRAQAERDAAFAKTRRRTIEDLKALAGESERKVLPLVLKADVQGSLEALKAAVLNIDVEGSELRILLDGVGNITESDVNLLAGVQDEGLIIGFNVRIDNRARSLADEIGVKPELYTVIYDVIDRVEGSLKGMLDPVYEEEHRGSAEVRQVFKISRLGTIAGCFVLEGKIGRNHGARLYRDNEEIWTGDVKSLKRFKDDVKEVASGYECGLSLEGFNDIEEGDVIQTFEMVRVDPE